MDLGPHPLAPGLDLVGVFTILVAGRVHPSLQLPALLRAMELFRIRSVNALTRVIRMHVANVAESGVASRVHVLDMVQATLGREDPIAAGWLRANDFFQTFTPHVEPSFPAIAAPAPHPQSPGGNSWRR
jgi:hypothetical protein